MKAIEKLSALKVKSLAKRGRYNDGGGLYLQVAKGGSKQWIFRYQRDGRARQMGLGSAEVISLSDARKRARAAQALLADGNDPIDRRRAQRQQAREKARGLTFEMAAERYIKAHAPGWKNPVHRRQWPSTLKRYVFPEFGHCPVDQVDTARVLRVLEPIWTEKPETASRVRGRIEMILDWAKAHGLRRGDNPARLRGHLDKLLPKHAAIKKVRHQPALPYRDMPLFYSELSEREGVAAEALTFTILTAARTSEVTGAKLSEFDLERAVWTIPAERMKARREHRVALSEPALDIVSHALIDDSEGFVFVGAELGRSLSNMAMLKLVKSIRPDITVHGFRSTFRDWTRETTNFPREVAEAALAHVIADKAEAAYARGDVLEKRRELMAAWAAYCLSANRKD